MHDAPEKVNLYSIWLEFLYVLLASPNFYHHSSPFPFLVYCSKDCQREHWDEHKPKCDERASVRKNSKKVLKGDVPIECTMSHAGPVFTSHGGGPPPAPGIAIGIGPQMDLHFGTMNAGEMPTGVPTGLKVLRTAVHELVSRREDTTQYGEFSYKKFYEELIQNEKEWMDVSSGATIAFTPLLEKSNSIFPVLSIPGE